MTTKNHFIDNCDNIYISVQPDRSGFDPIIMRHFPIGIPMGTNATCAEAWIFRRTNAVQPAAHARRSLGRFHHNVVI